MDARRIGGTSSTYTRRLRQNATGPERFLWQRLRNRQLGCLKFRRQVPIGKYIVDFLCLEVMLVVEVDGDTHAFTQAADALRTAHLESEGFKVVRFTNSEVMGNMEGVLLAISSAAFGPSPSQAFGLGPALSQRERDV